MNIIKKLKKWWRKKVYTEDEVYNRALKNYLTKSCYRDMEYAVDLLDEEGLKSFAEFYEGNRPNLMLLIAKIEHEFISDEDFTHAELAATKQALGKVWKFLKRTSVEYSDLRAVREARRVKNREK